MGVKRQYWLQVFEEGGSAITEPSLHATPQPWFCRIGQLVCDLHHSFRQQQRTPYWPQYASRRTWLECQLSCINNQLYHEDLLCVSIDALLLECLLGILVAALLGESSNCVTGAFLLSGVVLLGQVPHSF